MTVREGKAAKDSESSGMSIWDNLPGKLAEVLAKDDENQKWVSENGDDESQSQPQDWLENTGACSWSTNFLVINSVVSQRVRDRADLTGSTTRPGWYRGRLY